MKKTLLLFAMLLGVLGAWAQVVIPEEGKYYVIKNFRSHKFAYYSGDGAQLLQQTNPTSATTQENLNKYMWYVTKAEGEGAYMLHNVATEKVYAAYNSFTEEGKVVYIKENPYKHGYVCVSSNSDATTDNTCWDDQGSQTKIGLFDPRQNDNAGTSWEFIEITQNTGVTYTLSDNAGNSFSGSFTGWDREMLPAVTGVAGYYLSNVAFANNNILTATVNFPFPVSKVNGTTNWTFIRSQAMTDGKAYLYVNSDGKVVTKSQHSGNGTYGYLPTGVEGDVQKWMWAIYPKLTDGKFTFQIKNASTNKFAPSVNGQTKPFNVNEAAGNYSWGTCTGGANGFYLDGTTLFIGANSSSEGEQDAIIWNRGSNNSHKGCNLEFTEPIYAANCELKDNSGNIYTGLATFGYTVEEGDVEKPQLTGVPTSLLVEDAWENGLYTATLNLPFAVTNEEKINPTFICAYASDVYKWHAVDNGIKTTKNVTATSSNVAAHLWEIISQFNNGAFTFQIKNIATGTFINSTSNGNSHDAGKVTLSETATNLTFESNGFRLPTGKYLSIGSSSGNTGAEQILGTWDSHNGTNLTFPVAKYNVTVGAAGYASLYTPIAGTLTGTARMITSEDIQDGYVTFGDVETNVSTPIPANQGAIVIGEGTYTFTAGDVTADWSANLLDGSAVNTYVEGEAYVLSAPANKVGLYKTELNMNEAGENVGKEAGTHFLNNAGKAYLPASALTGEAAEARFFVFDFGGNETAIENVEAENAEQNTEVYDLAGRRVQGAQKGIFIVNGKKVVR